MSQVPLMGPSLFDTEKKLTRGPVGAAVSATQGVTQGGAGRTGSYGGGAASFVRVSRV